MNFTQDRFWKFIDVARAAYSEVDALYEVLADEVWQLMPHELKEFQVILEGHLARANTKALWHAARICLGEVDASVFLGFRSWLVSRGKVAFEAALAKPDSIAVISFEGEPLWGDGESLVNLAGKAWVQWADEDEGLPFELPGTGIEFRAPPPGDDWSEARIQNTFPALIKRFAHRGQS